MRGGEIDARALGELAPLLVSQSPGALADLVTGLQLERLEPGELLAADVIAPQSDQVGLSLVFRPTWGRYRNC